MQPTSADMSAPPSSVLPECCVGRRRTLRDKVPPFSAAVSGLPASGQLLHFAVSAAVSDWRGHMRRGPSEGRGHRAVKRDGGLERGSVGRCVKGRGA